MNSLNSHRKAWKEGNWIQSVHFLSASKGQFINTSAKMQAQSHEKQIDACCSKLIENYKTILKSSQIDTTTRNQPKQSFEEFQTVVATENIVSIPCYFSNFSQLFLINKPYLNYLNCIVHCIQLQISNCKTLLSIVNVLKSKLIIESDISSQSQQEFQEDLLYQLNEITEAVSNQKTRR